MKYLVAILVILLAASCNSTIALRSVVYHSTQEATTEGTITDNTKSGSHSVNAEKTTNDSWKIPSKEGEK